MTWLRRSLLASVGCTSLLCVCASQTVAQTSLETTDRVPSTVAKPPGLQRAHIRHDTPAERDAFLQRRAAAQERAKIETVPPLPAQAIAPRGSEPQEEAK